MHKEDWFDFWSEPFWTEFGAHPKNAFSFCRDLLISSQVLTAQTIQHYETLPGDKNKMLPETHIGDHNFERPDKHRLETNTRSY